MCYINQDLLVKIVTSYKFSTNVEVLPIEITLGKTKIWLLGHIDPHLILRMKFSFIWKIL